MTETICTESNVDLIEESYKVAYVFDARKHKAILKQFQELMSDKFDLDECVDPDEPTVIYTFKRYQDRYDLQDFELGPKYINAVDTFGEWLRAKYKYSDMDQMTKEQFKMLEEIWEEWCNTLAEECAVRE